MAGKAQSSSQAGLDGAFSISGHPVGCARRIHRGGENTLPSPLHSRVAVFSFEGLGQFNRTKPFLQILGMQEFDIFHMALQFFDNRFGKHGN